MSCSFLSYIRQTIPAPMPKPLPNPLIVQNVPPVPVPIPLLCATSANQRSISRTCLKYALTHRATTECGTHTPLHSTPLHSKPKRRSAFWVLPSSDLGQITPCSRVKHPPKNEFIFNINCSNRVTKATLQPSGATTGMRPCNPPPRRMWQLNQ